MKCWRKPLDADKIEVPLGVIHILEDQCKGCGFCVGYCPKDVLKLSDGYNIKGYHPPVVAKANDCVRCQLCEIICPEFSIFVTLKDQQATEEKMVELGKGVAVLES